MRIKKTISLLACNRGAAAIEAAIFLPLIVLFVLGAMDLHMRYRAQSITDLAATGVAQSLAMQQAVFDENNCNAANAICVYDTMAPALYQPLNFEEGGRLVLRVLRAVEDPDTNVVNWETGPGWPVDYGNASITAPRLGDLSNLPEPRAGDTLILAESLYLYEPITLSAGFWEALTGTRVMYSRSLARPRFGSLGVLAPAPED